MKKFIMILLSVCFYSLTFAQSLIERKDTIQINEITYKLKWDFGGGTIFEIGDIHNSLLGNYVVTKKGYSTSIGAFKKVKLAQESKDAEIIKEVFSKEEITALKNSYPKSMNPKVYHLAKPCLQYAVALDLNGKILNIKFRFQTYPGILKNLKPERIYQLEKRFREELKFVIPQEYKEWYDYIPSWFYRVDFDSL